MTLRPRIYYSEMDSPIGTLTLAKSEKGICFIEFGSVSSACASIKAKLRKMHINGELAEDPAALVEEKHQLAEYFSGERKTFDLPLDLIGSTFQKLVWEKVKDIPYGSTKSYKQIASEIGAPKAVRAIGGANNKNPVPIIIPCHRVIGSNGAMVGYGGGLDKKEILLRLEGAFEKLTS
ncbi:methylated-DNA--[protein]-cysteine S-methyltransferase [Salipaludibacillus aurantiacus]|uniref:Methylated-DNA--protein-cysteine methyltransferase n=1 Tax=Salipaludibacillus aurantiacus TaxID=1601833 RepID=A0A1H9X907_9BACI|nr:methylated-DNA--[protein]-cysteine S-methyltransferase [Salipaludibacillus aurantiacus]SES42559.1 methylated-DNA-[protein]-cysteine S-methyltransferase [Salipaludibacillus aurantiacus]